MTLRHALNRAVAQLATLPDNEAASLESEVLLRYVLGIDRVQLYLALDQELQPQAELHFQECIRRRLKGEPVAYITRHREFYGLDFYVDPRVLIPRPETELLIEETLCLARQRPVKTIADIGTGSGAIAVSLAMNLTEAAILAADISEDALAVAAINISRYGFSERITLVRGDLLEPVKSPVDVLIANLPYVTRPEIDRLSFARYEPRQALNGGEQGLDCIFRLADQLNGKVLPGGMALLEIGMEQGRAAAEYLQRSCPESRIDVLPDLAGLDRVIRVGFPAAPHHNDSF